MGGKTVQIMVLQILSKYSIFFIKTFGVGIYLIFPLRPDPFSISMQFRSDTSLEAGMYLVGFFCRSVYGNLRVVCRDDVI